MSSLIGKRSRARVGTLLSPWPDHISTLFPPTSPIIFISSSWLWTPPPTASTLFKFISSDFLTLNASSFFSNWLPYTSLDISVNHSIFPGQRASDRHINLFPLSCSPSLPYIHHLPSFRELTKHVYSSLITLLTSILHSPCKMSSTWSRPHIWICIIIKAS